MQFCLTLMSSLNSASRHVNDDWLERLYHSCQQSDKAKNKETVLDLSLGSKLNGKNFANSVSLEAMHEFQR